MQLPVYKTVRIVLLNSRNELLLMSIEADADDDIEDNKVWCIIGTAIDEGESVKDAITEEIYAATGISAEHITIGPAVWQSSEEITLYPEESSALLHETYVVATTDMPKVPSRINDSNHELKWWKLEELQNTTEDILPTDLKEYLPDVIAGNYPAKPIDIGS